MEPDFFRTEFLDPAGLHTGPDTIDDYAPTIGPMRAAAASLNHARPGDEVKAARHCRDGRRCPADPAPPARSRHPAGLRRQADSFRKEMAVRRYIALSTDHGQGLFDRSGQMS
ncbi:hypothetical protein [Streptomyces sp. NBC_00316]|uniref:hypothetical protein n=1 Tax=Streptomyces sp. NBC_00316 TaxID=2975710 RepID=UPI002E2DCD4F|nr:hypothetical protein [Streptomyces sp. NBC_00316]